MKDAGDEASDTNVNDDSTEKDAGAKDVQDGEVVEDWWKQISQFGHMHWHTMGARNPAMEPNEPWAPPKESVDYVQKEDFDEDEVDIIGYMIKQRMKRAGLR